MAKRTEPRDLRRAVLAARHLVEDVANRDGNEAETRIRVARIFESVMGYDMEHLSQEYAVGASGLTVHVDFAVVLDKGPDAKPKVMVELKRVGIDLRPKHLRQVTSYAINAGCNWILLTNGREWRLYRVTFKKPPDTKLVDQWNLLKDDIRVLTKKFEHLSYRNVRRDSLEKLWQKTQVLAPESILGAVLSADSLRQARRLLRKKTDVLVDPEDLVNGLRRLLNEAAVKTLDSMQLDLSPSRRRERKPRPKKAAPEEPKNNAEVGPAAADDEPASPDGDEARPGEPADGDQP